MPQQHESTDNRDECVYGVQLEPPAFRLMDKQIRKSGTVGGQEPSLDPVTLVNLSFLFLRNVVSVSLVA